MLTDYLQWYKDLELNLHGQSGVHRLFSSSVSEPRQLLERHLQEFSHRGMSAFEHLSSVWGHPAVAANVASRYDVDPRHVLITNGVSNAVYLLSRALLKTGSQVTVESPAYEPLVASPDLIGARIGRLRRSPPDYQIDPEEVTRFVNRATDLIIISNLHNPSGAFLSNETLTETLRRARAVNPRVMIVVDEVYHDFVGDRQAPAATLDEGFISLNSLTKVYGLGCLHCGWIMAQPDVIAEVRRLQMVVEGSYARLLEDIVAFVTARLDEYLDRARAIVERNRVVVLRHVRPFIESGLLGGDVPDKGCIYFPEVRTAMDGDVMVERLGQQFGVYVVPGRFFGDPGRVRLGFGGPSQDLPSALERFLEACRSLSGE